MAALKTRQTDDSVDGFHNSITDDKKRQDCFTVLELMKQVTNMDPRMWGPTIVGFGKAHFKYDSGREGDWFLVGFSPRKQNLTLYIMDGVERHPELLKTLGKYKTGVSCLYIKALDDIHLPTLKKLVASGVAGMKKLSVPK